MPRCWASRPQSEVREPDLSAWVGPVTGSQVPGLDERLHCGGGLGSMGSVMEKGEMTAQALRTCSGTPAAFIERESRSEGRLMKTTSYHESSRSAPRPHAPGVPIRRVCPSTNDCVADRQRGVLERRTIVFCRRFGADKRSNRALPCAWILRRAVSDLTLDKLILQETAQGRSSAHGRCSCPGRTR